MNLTASSLSGFSAECVDGSYGSGGWQIGSRISMKVMNFLKSGHYQQAVIIPDQKLWR